jgi:hypothetical protein
LALIDRRAKPAFRRDPYAVMPGISPAMTGKFGQQRSYNFFPCNHAAPLA